MSYLKPEPSGREDVTYDHRLQTMTLHFRTSETMLSRFFSEGGDSADLIP
jgi:hypothetical protein